MTAAVPQRRYHDTVPTTVLPDHRTCTEDPAGWEAPQSPNPSGVELLRVRDAQFMCMACPALAPCRRFLAGWRFPDGVVAGRVFLDGVELLTRRAAA